MYEFYSESASGDGYEHFFSDLQYFGVDFDYAKELLVQLISDDKKLVKSYDKAKKYYDKKGEDGYYEKYSKYYVLRDKFLEEVINQFIQNNIELYNK